ncbi:HTH-type transcriptional activator RhaS [compost metagenome]
MHSPEDHLAMNWSSDCRKIVVRIERNALERHAVSLLGRRPRQPLGFQVGMDLSRAAGRAWSNMAHCVFEELQRAPHLFEAPLIRTQFEQTLMTTLLQWQPNNLQGEEHEHKNKVLPRYVKLAEEYLQAHPEQPITAEMLANLTGVSARSLYSGFQSFLGMSPMRYLRDIRMERVRQDLLDPHKPRSVTEIATHWGFFQLGRFATEYRNRFAEAPRETILKRH